MVAPLGFTAELTLTLRLTTELTLTLGFTAKLTLTLRLTAELTLTLRLTAKLTLTLGLLGTEVNTNQPAWLHDESHTHREGHIIPATSCRDWDRSSLGMCCDVACRDTE